MQVIIAVFRNQIQGSLHAMLNSMLPGATNILHNVMEISQLVFGAACVPWTAFLFNYVISNRWGVKISRLLISHKGAKFNSMLQIKMHLFIGVNCI